MKEVVNKFYLKKDDQEIILTSLANSSIRQVIELNQAKYPELLLVKQPKDYGVDIETGVRRFVFQPTTKTKG